MNRLVGEGNWITISGLDYDSIVLKEGIEKPSREQFQQTLELVESEYNSQIYREKRSNDYPSIGDQLDDLFHSGAFSSEMAAKLQAVKDKYPKGS